jgi:hypothetical protein
MARLLEPLGCDEGHNQVDSEPQHHGETDNKLKHGVASELADGAGVLAERKKDTGAQRQIDQIEHGRTPTNETAGMSRSARQGSIGKVRRRRKDFIRTRHKAPAE